MGSFGISFMFAAAKSYESINFCYYNYNKGIPYIDIKNTIHRIHINIISLNLRLDSSARDSPSFEIRVGK